jgi:hypothetical protein
MLQQPFKRWFPIVVQEDIENGEDVSDDIRALMDPPSLTGKSFRSIYAYRNHHQVCSVEGPLSTCDNGVAATFAQSCCTSSSDRNMTTLKLEYIGWMEEIIVVDYGRFELVLLYCSWMQANTEGARATVKRDDYGFTLIKFDRLIPHSA